VAKSDRVIVVPGTARRIEVELSEYRGQIELDIRTWWFNEKANDGEGEWQRTKQGTRHPLDMVPLLQSTITKLMAGNAKRGEKKSRKAPKPE